VNETEERAQKKSKVWYDKKAKELSYKKSEQVLLLLPLIGKSLQAKYRLNTGAIRNREKIR